MNNMFYRGYNPFYRYYGYQRNYFPYSTNFLNYSNFENSTSMENKSFNDNIEKNLKDEEDTKTIKQEPEVKDDKKEENNNNGFRIGPVKVNNNRISAFGYSFAIDDLIIVALIVFLLFESSCDYTLLIVLGLILFDISFSSLKLFS